MTNYSNGGQPVNPPFPGAGPAREMSPIEACKAFWMRYTDFDGRSRRAEFWWSYLMVWVVVLLLGWTVIVPLACVIPSIAINVRRLHDIGKSGWYYLLYFIPIAGTILMIYWGLIEGQRGPNEYGPDPKNI